MESNTPAQETASPPLVWNTESCSAMPYLTEEGVAFTVPVGFDRKQCIVSRDALFYLSASRNDEAELFNIFQRFEDRIYRVAQRLIIAGAPTPLTLNVWSFR
jgi:hypothetical protein